MFTILDLRENMSFSKIKTALIQKEPVPIFGHGRLSFIKMSLSHQITKV